MVQRRITRRRLFGLGAGGAALLATRGLTDLLPANAAETAAGGIEIFDYAIEGNDQPIPLTDALQRWRPGRFSTVIAQSYMLRGLWPAIKAANPALRWGVYTNATHTDMRNHAPPYFPHDWYLWDAQGRVVTSIEYPGNALMNPLSGWKAYREDASAQLVRDTNATGMYADEVGVGPITSVASPPIDPRNGQPWTWGAWMVQMTRMLDGYRAAVPGVLMANGLGNGQRYFEAPTADLLDHAEAVLAESFLRGGTQPATYYPTPATYDRDVRMIADAGPRLMACTKIWVGEAADRARVLRWALGSFLLGASAGASWYSTAQRAISVTPWRAEWTLAKRLGAPLGPRVGLRRDFEGGSITVDNTAHDTAFVVT